MANDDLDRYKVITHNIDKLLIGKETISKSLKSIGTVDDDNEFRKQLRADIGDITKLCRTIKKNFNQINLSNHSQQADIDKTEQLQKQFIQIFTELKKCIKDVKDKTKPNNNNNNNDIASESIFNISSFDMQNTQLKALQNQFNDIKHVYNDLQQLKNDQKDDNNNDNVPNAIVNIKQDADVDMKQDIDLSDADIVVKYILLEGFLDKKSRYIKSWRKRWVVLDINTEDVTLFTFKNQKIYKYPTETILIDNYIQIKDVNDNCNEFCIINNKTKQKFIFKAANKIEKRLWINTIQSKQSNMTGNDDNDDDIGVQKKDLDLEQEFKDISDNIADLKCDINGNIKKVHSLIDDYDDHDDNKMNDMNVINNVNVKQNGYKNDIKTFDDNGKTFDCNHLEVVECLAMIDDLKNMIDDDETDVNDRKIINEFKDKLKDNGVVTQNQINGIKDVSIKLISLVLDRSEQIERFVDKSDCLMDNTHVNMI